MDGTILNIRVGEELGCNTKKQEKKENCYVHKPMHLSKTNDFFQMLRENKKTEGSIPKFELWVCGGNGSMRGSTPNMYIFRTKCFYLRIWKNIKNLKMAFRI